MSDHTHRWRTVYEESIIGIGAFVIGYRCEGCKEWVDKSECGPAGLGGVDTGIKELHGPHGCTSRTSEGKPYKKQTAYPDGRLEIE